MGRPKETYSKKEVRDKKEKKRKEKEKKRLAKKDADKNSDFDSMIAYVDENGRITSEPPDPDKKKDVDLESIAVSVPKQEEIEDGGISTGKVVFFDTTKGFGFIKDSVTGEDVFVHINNVEGEIKENDTVTFEKESGPKGKVAVQVKVS